MKNLPILAAVFAILLSGCSAPVVIDKQESVEAESQKRAKPIPMMLVNPGSVVHTSVTKPIVFFPKDIVINLMETETLVTFTDVFSGNRTTVQGDVDISFLEPSDYHIIDWRKNK